MDPEAVRSRSDLAEFIRQLRADLLSDPTQWENTDLDQYLEALGAWTGDMQGYFADRGESEPAQPSWSLIAQMLMAASVNE